MNVLKRAATQLVERVADLAGKDSGKRIELSIAIAITALSVIVYAAVTGIVPGGTLFGFVENVELRSLDAMFKARGPRPADPRIVIADIDDNTLRKVGAWPIPRSGYAAFVDRMREGGAKVVAFDVSFPTPEKNSAVEALRKLESELGKQAPASLLDKIRAIEATSDNDKILAASMKRAGNVILGHSFLDPDAVKNIPVNEQQDYYGALSAHPFPAVRHVGKRAFAPHDVFMDEAVKGQVAQGVIPNIRILADEAADFGYYDTTPDADGTVRNATLLVYFKERKDADFLGGDFFTSLPVETLRVYERINDDATVGEMTEHGLDNIELGPHTIHTAPNGTALINWAGPYRTYPHYSMADIIDGTVPASTFKDKIVFLGATAKGIGDLRTTPFTQQDTSYMGVETHANVLDNLLHSDSPSRTFIRRGLNQEILDLSFIVAFGLGMGYVFGRVKPLYATLSMIGALLVYVGIVRVAFGHFGMWMYVVVPTAALVLNYGGITSYRMIFEEREKRKVRKTFARYVSPGVIGLIEKDPKKYFKPGGETKELTIMFTDIRSFTTISEGMTAAELVQLLNEYLGEMTGILFQRWGTLDKYIGDALMAFWGSPYPQEDHHVRACACALDMTKRLEELNRKWEGLGKKTLEIGIGINTGMVNVGNMGSEQRVQWTVMGDAVNLASRLEGQNKAYHTTRIISEFTYEKVRDQFVCRALDRIRVKGKLKPVGIYELLAFKKEAGSYADLTARWSDAQDAYYRQAWNEAIQRFESLLSRYPDDGPSHAFLKRSHEYLMHAPEPGWDGVYVAKEK